MAENQEVIRTPDYVAGPLSEDEKARLREVAAYWTEVAFRSTPIDEAKIVPAIQSLYTASGLAAPQVIVVSSPLVMAVAGGFASAIKQAKAEDACLKRISDASQKAPFGPLEWQVVQAVVSALTGSTLPYAPPGKDSPIPESRPAMARALAETIGGKGALAKAMIQRMREWEQHYQGGNMMAAWPSYLCGLRDVLGLRLPQAEKFAAWEACAKEGGFRWMGDDFCMVSDFPAQRIGMDASNRLHNADGPSYVFRDGWRGYHIHGVAVPALVVEEPQKITVSMIESERNAEVRRVLTEKYGAGRYLVDSGAKVVSHDKFGILYRKEQPDDEPLVMVRVLNSTPEPDGTMTRDEAIATFGPAAHLAAKATQDTRWKEYFLRVDPDLRPMRADGWRGDPQEPTARNAVASTFGLRGEEDGYAPAFES